MFDKYLITGGTGYLGNTIIKMLLEKGAKKIKTLVVPKDRFESNIPSEVEKVYGYVNDIESLTNLFVNSEEKVCLIHCAGIVSIASKKNELIYDVNVNGTKNVLDLSKKYNVEKVIYVSSVHAITEKKKGQMMSESKDFSSKYVKGAYAKTKAEATAYALECASLGLNVSVVHPSGIIGPNDFMKGNITQMIISYCKGKLPIAVKGGYDFVDVRDVASGILECLEKGKKGECYILSNRFVSVKELLQTLQEITNGKKILGYLPLWVGRLIAPCYELSSIIHKKPIYFTPYSIYTLGTNALFSHDKATEELSYKPRLLKETLTDAIAYLKEVKLID